MQYKEIQNLAKEYYAYMGDIIAESIWAFSTSWERVCKLVEFEDAEAFNEVSAKNGSVILAVGHQGNWELLGCMRDMKLYGVNIKNDSNYILYKKQSSNVADMVIKKIRTIHKAGNVVEMNAAYRLMSTRKENGGGTYCLIADQFPDSVAKPHVVNFLNQPTYMIQGPEVISKKLKMGVVFMSFERKKRGHYVCSFKKITEDGSKEEPGYVTEKYARLLEESIINHKSSWLWSHRRWKSL